jgi:hypothetical protein
MIIHDSSIKHPSEMPSTLMEGGNISLRTKNKNHLLSHNKKQKHLNNASVFSITQKLRKDILSDLRSRGVGKRVYELKSPIRRPSEQKNGGNGLKEYLTRVQQEL